MNFIFDGNKICKTNVRHYELRTLRFILSNSFYSIKEVMEYKSVKQ